MIRKVDVYEILLIVVNAFYIFMAWLLKPEAFVEIATVMILFTVFLFLLLRGMRTRRTKRRLEALADFLRYPDEEFEEQLMGVTDVCWQPLIRETAQQRREYEATVNEKVEELLDYQEFIEEWVHEMKTPLSLATLVLNNHREEMTPYVYNRMDHVRHTSEEHVARILHYARLQADHMDYRFEKLNPEECIRESLGEFRAAYEERNIEVKLELEETEIVFDRKVLCFMLFQLFSNALKYTPLEHGLVRVVLWSEAAVGGRIHLAVRDNGEGAALEDRPFLFDKGFTGSYGGRKSATGMGLYLVKKYAKALGAEVFLEEHTQGFGVEIVFPKVEQESIGV